MVGFTTHFHVCCHLFRNVPQPACSNLAPYYSAVLTNAAAPAILAPAPSPTVLTNAAAPAILALAPFPAVLTNAAAPAILAPAPYPTVLTNAATPA